MKLKTSTIGYPSDHTEVKVVDDEGQVVPTGVAGELCTRGYSTMLGYWGDKEKTGQVYKDDRWFHTGDTAVIFENGYGQIVGRMKDMIIRGGENIYPREIEEFLHTHPDIAEVQAIGVTDRRLGKLCTNGYDCFLILPIFRRGASCVGETERRCLKGSDCGGCKSFL